VFLFEATAQFPEGCAPAPSKTTDMRDRNLPIRTNSLFEVSFASSGEHADPLHGVRVTATIAAPDGRTTRREAFWDGGQTWLLRISPDVPGVWRGCAGPSRGGSGIAGKLP
jgi:hypothetical protein